MFCIKLTFSHCRFIGAGFSPCKSSIRIDFSFFTGFSRFSFNYELYFGFSWIFTFISLDRWIKVEWPTKSQSWCTRQNYVYLCSISFLGSLIQNIIYALICFDDKCNQKTFLCEIMIHIIYISFYMTVPIGVIILSISRTFLISINLRKRFRNPTNSVNNQTTMITTATTTTMTTTTTTTTLKLDSIARRNSPSGGSRLSNSFLSSLSSSGNGNQSIHTPTTITRRRARIDTQMIVLISINVAPFILVHIITEIAYLFERYSTFVGQSNVARLSIIFVYLSWYLISATRFYTNCLLSRIYREEFKHRLRIFRRTCFNDRPTRRRVSSRLFMATSLANGIESSTVNHNQLQI